MIQSNESGVQLAETLERFIERFIDCRADDYTEELEILQGRPREKP